MVPSTNWTSPDSVDTITGAFNFASGIVSLTFTRLLRKHCAVSNTLPSMRRVAMMCSSATSAWTTASRVIAASDSSCVVTRSAKARRSMRFRLRSSFFPRKLDERSGQHVE